VPSLRGGLHLFFMIEYILALLLLILCVIGVQGIILMALCINIKREELDQLHFQQDTNLSPMQSVMINEHMENHNV
jgi:hypothetical protein